MRAGRRIHLVITGLYALSRVLLYVAGIRYGADYQWQHFLDIDLLKHRLWESIFYTHAFTPFISFLAGVVLKISEAHAVAIYQALFLVLGCAFVNSLGYLLVVVGLRPRWALATALLFSLTPGFVYLENFFHYEFIAASLVALSAVLFHRAVERGDFVRWSAFFLVCAFIAFVRTTFHLIWVMAVVALACLCQRRQLRTVIGAALIPLALVTALYVKNCVVFGFFGTSSNFGANLAYSTVRQLTKPELAQWVTERKISPISAVSVFAAPEDYAPFIDISKKWGVPALDQTHHTTGEINYNHWSYTELGKIRLRDDRYYIQQRPWPYIKTVLADFKTYFRETSRWHPFDQRGSGPHTFNRRTLGGWEDLYNKLFHTFPVRPFGLYVLLIPLFFVATYRAARALSRARFDGLARDKTVLYMAFCALYVTVISCMTMTSELSRYRFMVEGLIWAVCLSLFGRKTAESVGEQR